MLSLFIKKKKYRFTYSYYKEGLVYFNDIRHDIPTWCNIYNIKQATVNARIRKGWSSINAITTPVKGR